MEKDKRDEGLGYKKERVQTAPAPPKKLTIAYSN
jgi:hypothetical protein